MLKNKIGVGLRVPYIREVLENHRTVAKKIGWLEVHSENYYAAGGPSINSLIEIRKNFPISLHSVGNSLGSACGIDLKHLEKLKKLIEIIDPFLVSDHISWGYIANTTKKTKSSLLYGVPRNAGRDSCRVKNISTEKKHLNDLLPLPYNQEAFEVICKNISQVQDFLKREILIENPSAYLAFKNPQMSEFEFINLVAKKTGCKLLLDVNNIYVSACNNTEFDAKNYLKNIDKNIVKEIHLAGHSSSEIFDGKKRKEILIDTHNDVVRDEVWQLYEIAVQRFGEVPSLIEWDQDFPEFAVLLSEAKKAENIMKKYAEK